MTAAAIPEFEDRVSPRQINGYWFAPWSEKDIGVDRPDYAPTGAIIPETEFERILPGPEFQILALDLVRVDHKWWVLSESGVWTYSHSAGAFSNEHWLFVDWVSGRKRIFRLEAIKGVEPARAINEFGAEIRDRIRLDRDAVELVLTRDP